MSSFPDVLSATLTYNNQNQDNRTFTVPPAYAFAVVQVYPYDYSDSVMVLTSHGAIKFDNYLNLIIKGGESFSLLGAKFVGGSPTSFSLNAKVSALCHKKPT